MNSEASETQKLLADLDSDDANIRARAARRLWEIGHPEALDANLRTLDDAPDMLHADHTPAVAALIDIGEPALVPLLDRLDAPEQLSRMRAANAVIGITRKAFGYDTQRGWPEGAEARWYAWWTEIGYDAMLDEPAARAEAIEKLRVWATERGASSR